MKEKQNSIQKDSEINELNLRIVYSDGKKMSSIGSCWWPLVTFGAPLGIYFYAIQPGILVFKEPDLVYTVVIGGFIWFVYSIFKSIRIHRFNGEVTESGIRIGDKKIGWDQITGIDDNGDGSDIIIRHGQDDNLFLTIPSEIEDVSYIKSIIKKKIESKWTY